jgi:hypothetical protein
VELLLGLLVWHLGIRRLTVLPLILFLSLAWQAVQAMVTTGQMSSDIYQYLIENLSPSCSTH